MNWTSLPQQDGDEKEGKTDYGRFGMWGYMSLIKPKKEVNNQCFG